MSTLTTRSGRGWAYLGAVLGGLVSIFANVAHSFITPPGAPAGWTPEHGAVGFAVVWPVVLFVAVEILARTPWPKTAGFYLLRWIGLPPVAFVAALVSYRHLSGLLAHYSEDTLVQTFGPIAIDGLMLMATGAIIATSPRTPTTPAAPIPVPATADTRHVATPAAAVPDEPAPRPARPAAKRTPAKKSTPRKAAPRKVTTPTPTTTPPARPAVATTIPSEQADTTASRHDTVPAAPEQAPAPSTPDISVTTVDAAPPPKLPVPAALLTRARHLADAHHTATGQPIAPGVLAVRLRVNTETAVQLLAVLDLDPGHRSQPVTAANGAPVKDRQR